MSGITSVEGTEIPASLAGSILSVIVGFLVMFTGLTALVITGMLFMVLGVVLLFRRKSTYAVVLRTAGGEITAYQGRDKNHIAEIIQAINNAIAARG